MKPSYTKVDFEEALGSVSPKVKQAFELSHQALNTVGVPHVVIGGLAVNAYGHHYSTKDVDYLVAAEDAFNGTLVLTHKPGVPFEVGGVPIDYLTEQPDFPEVVRREMEACIAASRERPDGIVVAPDWLLVWMKLNAGRSKDVSAVEGLVKVGLDVVSVRERLALAGVGRVNDLFDRCVERADDV